MKEAVKRVLRPVKRAVMSLLGPYQWGRSSYSQEGEDIALDRLPEGQRQGLYVDVGCHHPFRFSNTYMFYRRGWSGICIDPLPGTRRLFNRWRKRDIVLEAGVSRQPAQLTYHMFDEPAVNTFDAALASERLATTPYKKIGTVTVPTKIRWRTSWKPTARRAARSISSASMSKASTSTCSNRTTWNRFRPRVVVVECLKTELSKLADESRPRASCRSAVMPYAKTGNSVLFVQSAHG